MHVHVRVSPATPSPPLPRFCSRTASHNCCGLSAPRLTSALEKRKKERKKERKKGRTGYVCSWLFGFYLYFKPHTRCRVGLELVTGATAALFIRPGRSPPRLNKRSASAGWQHSRGASWRHPCVDAAGGWGGGVDHCHREVW